MIRRSIYDASCFAIGIPLGFLAGMISAAIEKVRNVRT